MEENSRKLLEAIQNTANDALEAKQSCVETGYYRDDFLRHFTKGYQKRSPVINRGYYCRVKAVENILIKFCQNFEDRPKQVVSLGCGFDTTFFRLKHHHNIIFSNYIELDYKSIVSAKSEIIKNEKKLFSHLKNFKIKNGIKSDDYNLMSCDLSNIETIKKAFSEHKISYSAPTIFIAECVLIYMDSESSNNLIEWTTKSFSDEIVFVNYEQIHPGDCFSDMMIKNLAARNLFLKSFEQYPNLKSQEERFKNLGFDKAEAKDMNQIFEEIMDRNEIAKMQELELLDEIEELQLIHRHYCIVVASKNIKRCFLNIK